MQRLRLVVSVGLAIVCGILSAVIWNLLIHRRPWVGRLSMSAVFALIFLTPAFYRAQADARLNRFIARSRSLLGLPRRLPARHPPIDSVQQLGTTATESQHDRNGLQPRPDLASPVDTRRV
jgi:hypothetical protein